MTSEAALFAGHHLTYAFLHTSIGVVVVAEGAKGIAAILIGSDHRKLLTELRNSCPGARLVEDGQAIASTTDAVARMFSKANEGGGELKLDARGSPLERAVWEALRRVASGQTITYGEIARHLDMPATPREVGAACAANRIAVAIPCHRVVKADGSISGYRWGVERKRKLINREGIA